MKRDYKNINTENAVFFTGSEVERTPAFGLQTLFVVGLQSASHIQSHITKDIKHIFFGANHSFDPSKQQYDYDYYEEWETMITHFLSLDYWCSLDIPSDGLEEFNSNTKLLENKKFIPQIRLVIPNVRDWNKNTMIKIDDADFEYSNQGVWCSSLEFLLKVENFTKWEDYKQDEILDDKIKNEVTL